MDCRLKPGNDDGSLECGDVAPALVAGSVMT
jgi:hypothetical protein